jgi:hypothetical protein
MSIATCNKLFENMTPFYGDKTKPRISGRVESKNLSWIIDTGSAVTCMNILIRNGFWKNFKNQRKIQNQYIHKKGKCTHTVVIMDEFSENILGVDFIQKH